MLEPTNHPTKSNSTETDTDANKTNVGESSSPNVGLCPKFHYAVELIGKRWTGAIINVLLLNEGGQLEPTDSNPSTNTGTRFHDIRSNIPELSDRMLSERLKELEVAGIVIREVYPETPVRVEYRLTPKGNSLKPIMETIGQWSQEWVE